MLLGIDCGSVAVKAVLLSSGRELEAAAYRRNCGIVETLRDCLSELGMLEISGVGVTGSGRSLTAMVVGADVVKTEIFAHAVAAMAYEPGVQTVLDIGGEDSKLIKIRDEVVCDFKMNHMCGAGTGALIDSIAVRLGVKTEEVGELALQHGRELDIPGKCGVFAQSAVVSKLNAGASTSDLLWGVCKALVRNYALLGKGIELRPPYVFQGAVARNEAVVAAMRQELGWDIAVPDYCAFMGAIGVALLAGEQRIKQTKFRGMRRLDGMSTRMIRGDGCSNRCEIVQVLSGEGKVIGFMGARCEKCGIKDDLSSWSGLAQITSGKAE